MPILASVAKETVPGLVLPAEATASSEGQVFVGFPGVYYPDQPVAIETMGGLSADEAYDLAAELELPLEKAQAEVEREPSGFDAMTVPELDAYAADNSLDDYPKSKSKAEKIAYLENAALDAPATEEPPENAAVDEEPAA